MPFDIINEGFSLVARPKIHLIGYDGLWFKVLKPNESHTFVYMINRLYGMRWGIHNYSLVYYKPFYDMKDHRNQAEDQVNKFDFTWHRKEGSDKGTLINTDFDSKNYKFIY